MMYDHWYDYAKHKDGDKTKLNLWYKDTGSFIIHVKSVDVFEDLAGDIE